MNIGLIDVDSHNGFPNLALMKLSAWHKQQGDDVGWYNIFDHYDIVYMAKVFTFTEDYGYSIDNAEKIIRGGTGVDYAVSLPDQVDRTFPDYDMYRLPSDIAYGFLTRGCIRKCPWCIVPKKEGNIHPYMDIEEVTHERRKVILMDNNILASDYGIWQIEKIIKLGKVVDFNQAMDARLVTDDIARLLARVKWLGHIRFGCDTAGQITHCERAIRLIQKHGYNGQFMLYTMLHGSIGECYERVSRWRVGWNNKVCCQSQPMLCLTRKEQHIPLWQKDMARWSNKQRIYFATDFKDYEPRKGMKGKDFFT